MALVPVPPCLSPKYLQLAVHQCRLRLNDRQVLVPSDTVSLYGSPPTTIGFQTLKAMPAGLGPGWLRSSTAPLLLDYEGKWETGSLVPLVATAFSLSPSLGVGFSPQSIYDLGDAEHIARSCDE